MSRTGPRAGSTLERETKFEVARGFAVPDLTSCPGVRAALPAPPRTLRATYYDSTRLTLVRSGVTLRHRTGEGAPRWTLKLPSGPPGAGLSREEVSADGPAGDVPPALLDLLTPWLRGQPLVPVAVLGTRRRSLVLTGARGQVLGEVVDDSVTVQRDGRPAGRFREVEVELGSAPGAAEACEAVTRALAEAGARSGQQLPKLVRALGPVAQEPPDVEPTPAVRRRSSASTVVRASLRSSFTNLVVQDRAVRRAEPDGVHQLRVVCRRLRSDLRLFSGVLDDPRVGPLRDELGWLGTSLGQARDLEVLRARVAAGAASDPLAPLDPTGLGLVFEQLDAALAAATARAHLAVGSERYVACLQLLADVAAGPGFGPTADERAARVLAPALGAQWAHLDRRARRLGPDDPDTSWHRVRILAKRVRYAAEASTRVLGPPARRMARAAAGTQLVLGEHQDAAMAAAWLLAEAETAEPVLALTLGRLAERERSAVRAARGSFPAAWRQSRHTAHG